MTDYHGVLASKKEAQAVKLALIYSSLPMCQALFKHLERYLRKQTNKKSLIIIICFIMNKVNEAQRG